jgi:hypothetical protein
MVHSGGHGANMNWQERHVDVIAVEGTNRLQFFSPLMVLALGAALDAVLIAPITGPGPLADFMLAGFLGRRRR